MMILGYQDANDVTHLQHGPLFKDVLQGDLASRPTISRFENSMDKHSIFELCNTWADHYVSTLCGRKRIIIKTRATYLLKVGATIKITKRRIFYQLSKAFVYKNLFREIITR
ncbi:hypothetical protein MNBD_BACTEROID03-990 [hydrothermal vent metagenome]|uniref:Transposase DDE domain-containing protein n=1 Tax=hydrothermal vent metagenome TaxID=652676 RepID=A0A3B0T269_9ZZZZ